MNDKALQTIYRRWAREFYPDSQRPVFVVSGAPGSGKSTYVRENATDQDLILDMDMFFREHRRDGRIARFDASYEQAEAWQRLVSGKNIRESDRVMLLHEQMESRIMKETGCTYEEAHKQTNKVYNWAKAYLEEGGVFK